MYVRDPPRDVPEFVLLGEIRDNAKAAGSTRRRLEEGGICQLANRLVGGAVSRDRAYGYIGSELRAVCRRGRGYGSAAFISFRN